MIPLLQMEMQGQDELNDELNESMSELTVHVNQQTVNIQEVHNMAVTDWILSWP